MDDLTMGIAFLFMMLFVVVLAVGAYILTALMYSRLLKGLGHSKPSVAWIPVYNQVSACESTKAAGVTIFNKYLPMQQFRLFAVIPLASCVVNVVPILGSILGMLMSLAYLMGSYWFYKLTYSIIDGRDEVGDFDILAFLSLFVPLIPLFKFFTFSTDKVNFSSIERYNAQYVNNGSQGFQSYGQQSQQGFTQQGFQPYNQQQGFQPYGQQSQQGFTQQGFQPYNQQQGFQPYGQQPQGFSQQGFQQPQGFPQQQGFQQQSFQQPQNFQDFQNVQTQQSSGDDDDLFIQ